MKPVKFNLTIIDFDSTVENFLYRGVSKDDKEAISTAMLTQGVTIITFKYDEGEVFTRVEPIHSLVFSEYISEADEGTPEDE